MGGRFEKILKTFPMLEQELHDSYSVTDSSRVTIDLTAPSLSSVLIQSDNAASETRANDGDTIILSIAANEAIVEPTVNIAGQAATVTGTDARTWFCTGCPCCLSL